MLVKVPDVHHGTGELAVDQLNAGYLFPHCGSSAKVSHGGSKGLAMDSSLCAQAYADGPKVHLPEEEAPLPKFTATYLLRAFCAFGEGAVAAGRIPRTEPVTL